MSFIDKDYPIITLPRVNDLNLPERLQVSTLTSLQDSAINLGISKSNISTYLINPSPRLVWSAPISPSTTIECIDNNTSFHIIGATDRRLFKVLKLTAEQNEIQQEYKTSCKVKHIKIINELIYVILGNGDLKVLDFDFNLVHELNEQKNTKTSKQQQDALIYGGIDGNFILMVLKTKEGKDTKLKYKLVNKDLTFKTYIHSEDFQDSIFDFTQGHIYKFNKSTQEVSKMNLSFKVEAQINLAVIVGDKNDKEMNGDQEDIFNDFSFLAPSEDRVIICNNKTIFLINVKFNTVLDTYELDTNSCNYLVKAVKVKGNSLNSLSTIVLFLKLNLRKNKLTLNLININIGTNNLLANLGKGFNANNNTEILELTDLLEDDYENKPNQFFDKAKKLYNGKSKKDKDLQSFEHETLKYFKGDNQVPSDSKKLNYYHYDITDKNVDINFMREFLGLILSKDEEGNVVFVNTNKIPKRVLNYFLTHKLYPDQYSKGLIKLLTPYPRLLKTCIINCPNLNLSELVELLTTSASSKDIDLKLINEVINKLIEFNLNDLINSLKAKLSIEERKTINALINQLVKINNFNSWFLLKLIMDINGIINLNLSADKIEKLAQIVDYKLSLLDLNSFNLNLINEKLTVTSDHVPNYSFEKLKI